MADRNKKLAAADRTLRPENSMAGWRMVIAIVDDDVAVLTAIDRLLWQFGYRTTELFASAEEFLGAEAKSKAVCLIVDVELGNISGLELVRRLSAKSSRLPVIFMSGSDSDEHRRQAMDLGAAAYLEKTDLPDLLIPAIERAIGSSR